jgi:hypothetical protein
VEAAPSEVEAAPSEVEPVEDEPVAVDDAVSTETAENGDAG